MTPKKVNRYLCKVWLLMIFITTSQVLYAKDGDTKVIKTMVRNFAISNTQQLQVNNKYGQVSVTTWTKDSVRVEIQITTYAKGESNATRLMERVDFDFISGEEVLRIETVLDREKDYLTELWNKLTDYSKVVLSKNNLTINYKVFMPANTRLNLENKFGDVYVDQITERSRIAVAYGNLKTGELNAFCVLDIQFGKADIKYIRDAQAKVRISEIEVQQSDYLNIESHSSTLNLASVNRLKINSRNDKIRIESVKDLSGTGSFSRFTIEQAAQNIDLDMNFGGITVSQVPRQFTAIDIHSKMSDVHLKFDRNVHCQLDVSGKQENLLLPRECSDFSKKFTDEKEKNVMMSGKLKGDAAGPGAPNGLPRAAVNSQGGEVKISFRQNNNNQ